MHSNKRTNDLISTDQKDYKTNCIIVENNLFEHRYFNPDPNDKTIEYFYSVVAIQNNINYDANLKEGSNDDNDKLKFICEGMIEKCLNWN